MDESEQSYEAYLGSENSEWGYFREVEGRVEGH